MIEFRKILVAVDFSAASQAALDCALSLAAKSDGSVHVLHAWEVPTFLRPDLTVWSGDIRQTLSDEVRLNSEKSMTQFLSSANVPGRADVTSKVVPGIAYEKILGVADEGKFDLIVMGTHGRTGLAHAVLGSVAEKVVRYAKCPVLTVRAAGQ